MKQNDVIYLEPRGGMCNRMRAIHSGYQLAKKKNAKLVLIWTVIPEYYAKFEEVFESIPDVKVVTLYLGRMDTLKHFLLRLFAELYRKMYLGRMDLQLYEMQSAEIGNAADFDWYNRQSFTSAYIRSYATFFESEIDATDFLKFKSGIINASKKVISDEQAKNAIGIHIRRTDHVEAIQNSGLSDFERVMDWEIEKNPKTQFYVASDDLETELYLEGKYGKRIIRFSDKEYVRQCRQGIVDAAVDLVCLSRTTKIYGSFTSSYSAMAAKLGRIPLVIVKKQQEISYDKKKK